MRSPPARHEHRPLVAMFSSVPLLTEALTGELEAVGDVLTVPADDDLTEFLKRQHPDAVVVDRAEDAIAAARVARTSGLPVFYIALREGRLRILQDGAWEDYDGGPLTLDTVHEAVGATLSRWPTPPASAGLDAVTAPPAPPGEGAHDAAPTRGTFLTFGEPLIGEEEITEVVETLRGGWIGTGPRAHELERRFAHYVGAAHACGVNSGTAALHLALGLLEIGPGDEVITTPMTFAATANVVEHQRARPVFADIDPATLTIDPREIERRVTSRTKAIIPVHFAGRACRMDEISAIAEAYGLPVVSDAAHAIETRYHGRPSGQLGHLVAYSFYVTKNLTTVEGGMVTTENEEWASQLRTRSLHGLSKDAWKRHSSEGFQPYETLYPGYKYNLTDLQAALGLHQLARLEQNLAVRERHFRAYREAFTGIDGLIVPDEDPDPHNRHARHLFVILLELPGLTVTRNEFIAALNRENVGAGVHFTALHLHRYYRERYGYAVGDYPVSEWVGERTVSLPLSAKLTDSDRDDVIAAVLKILERCRRTAAGRSSGDRSATTADDAERAAVRRETPGAPIPARPDESRRHRVARRVVDLAGGSVLLLLTAPVVLVAMGLIRLDSPGPAVFRQPRLGRGGRLFTLYKLRGMYTDAAARWPELYAYSFTAAEIADLRFHPEHDPRVTRVGRFIRRTSIDELPNFWNVVRGDMSLVGPRPEIPEMLPYYGEAADTVLRVKPGVTSLAKTCGRDGLSFQQTLNLDLEYVARRSLLFDLRILWRTVVIVLSQRSVRPG